MLRDNMKLVGKLSIAVNDEIVQEVNNLVVTTGKNYVASRIKDTTAAAMSHMAIGTGSTSPAAGDTTLGTETARVALTSTTVTNADVAYVASFGAGTGTGAITEAGLFNSSSAGTLFCRTTFSVVNKGADDSMTITWTVTVS
ncbi:MAG: hypothetical protein CBD88_07555 [Flavobacteriales bacterium TMED228]|nr:MAG: hypothetical protein CBD88_07555 [Flavobacteriales bacterium TMED228]